MFRRKGPAQNPLSGLVLTPKPAPDHTEIQAFQEHRQSHVLHACGHRQAHLHQAQLNLFFRVPWFPSSRRLFLFQKMTGPNFLHSCHNTKKKWIFRMLVQKKEQQKTLGPKDFFPPFVCPPADARGTSERIAAGRSWDRSGPWASPP